LSRFNQGTGQQCQHYGFVFFLLGLSFWHMWILFYIKRKDFFLVSDDGFKMKQGICFWCGSDPGLCWDSCILVTCTFFFWSFKGSTTSDKFYIINLSLLQVFMFRTIFSTLGKNICNSLLIRWLFHLRAAVACQYFLCVCEKTLQNWIKSCKLKKKRAGIRIQLWPKYNNL
jgi:hypothetical protein